MQSAFLKLAAVAVLALGLSACATHPPMLAAGETGFVDKVDVELRQPVASATFGEVARKATRREATRYSRTGAPKAVRITVTQLHYKNAAMSLLIGDANSVSAAVVVSDAGTGKIHGQFETTQIDQVALNGLAGAMISLMQDRAAVDQRLADSLASDVLERVYGTAVAQEARKRPTVEVVEEVKPAGPSAPATPKPAPAKRAKEDKTAMAASAGSIPVSTAR
ncbi:MAG: hypothetical protein ABW275_03085 [Hansschlegelia sp.]